MVTLRHTTKSEEIRVGALVLSNSTSQASGAFREAAPQLALLPLPPNGKSHQEHGQMLSLFALRWRAQQHTRYLHSGAKWSNGPILLGAVL